MVPTPERKPPEDIATHPGTHFSTTTGGSQCATPARVAVGDGGGGGGSQFGFCFGSSTTTNNSMATTASSNTTAPPFDFGGRGTGGGRSTAFGSSTGASSAAATTGAFSAVPVQQQQQRQYQPHHPFVTGSSSSSSAFALGIPSDAALQQVGSNGLLSTLGSNNASAQREKASFSFGNSNYNHADNPTGGVGRSEDYATNANETTSSPSSPSPPYTFGSSFSPPPDVSTRFSFSSIGAPSPLTAPLFLHRTASGRLFGSTTTFGHQQQQQPGQQGPGTRNVPFQPTNKQDGGAHGSASITLQSISAMPQYEQYSFEELRFQDLSTSTPTTFSNTSTFADFGTASPALFGSSTDTTTTTNATSLPSILCSGRYGRARATGGGLFSSTTGSASTTTNSTNDDGGLFSTCENDGLGPFGSSLSTNRNNTSGGRLGGGSGRLATSPSYFGSTRGGSRTHHVPFQQTNMQRRSKRAPSTASATITGSAFGATLPSARVQPGAPSGYSTTTSTTASRASFTDERAAGATTTTTTASRGSRALEGLSGSSTTPSTGPASTNAHAAGVGRTNNSNGNDTMTVNGRHIECVVCLDRVPVRMVDPCGHLCLCNDCYAGILIENDDPRCPCCSGKLTSAKTVYLP